MPNSLISFERDLYNKGVRLIAGVDEVGRGPLAGPFVVAAVILDLEKVLSVFVRSRINDVLDLKIPEPYNTINDSKKLTIKKREELNMFLLKEAVSYSIYEISSEELDKIGVSQATQVAFFGCIQKLQIKPEHVFTDRFEIKKISRDTQTNITAGDARSISIAAASIIAKVHRDSIMNELHKMYPNYGFMHNKGYGTKEHFAALKNFGYCPVHRKSFSPIKEMYELQKI